MALLCLVWPAEGISVAGHQLRWPTLREVMEVPSSAAESQSAEADAPELTPEERLALEMEAVYRAKEGEFQQFADSSPIRLHMPDSNLNYLEPFFRMLDGAGEQQVRVMHYGDSQLEEDRISSRLRNHLQEMFGGYGSGLQPAQWISHKMTVNQYCTPELNYNLAYGPRSYRLAGDNQQYGPLLQVSGIHGRARIHFTPCNYTQYTLCKEAERVSVLADGYGTLQIVTPDSTYLLVDNDTLPDTQLLTLDFAKRESDISLITNGYWNIYSLSFEGRTGVVLDNIALRGYDGTSFTKIDRSTMLPFFYAQHIGLVMLQFGGNAVPYLKGPESIERWKQGIGRQIDYFKSLAPSACIMLIGPADMSTSRNGVMQTYPNLPDVVDALREVADEHGVCFWSMYDAMGGWNSMVKWVEARPQLAGEDYIHFTHKGADRISDLLDQVILAYYRYYRLHNRLDPIEKENEVKQAADSARNDSVPVRSKAKKRKRTTATAATSTH